MSEENKNVDPEINPDDPLPNGSYFEHKAQQERRERERRRMRFPYPFWVNVAYLVLGFAFGLWHPGWIIYLTIPLFYLPDSQRTPIRLLGLRTTKLVEEDAPIQLSLFDYMAPVSEKQQKLDAALDSIRSRFGKDSIKRGSLLNSPSHLDKEDF